MEIIQFEVIKHINLIEIFSDLTLKVTDKRLLPNRTETDVITWS